MEHDHGIWRDHCAADRGVVCMPAEVYCRRTCGWSREGIRFPIIFERRDTADERNREM